MSLADQRCIPCTEGTPPLTGDEIQPLLTELGPMWQVGSEGHLHKKFKLDDFTQAVEFVDAIALVAEAEGHHPDLCMGWGRVEVELWTHKIHGLSEADFVMAAKIDRVGEVLRAGLRPSVG